MPKFVSPKKARPPKAKDAVRVKSGCYTRRIRHKKCDKRPDEFGRCETCVRRHIQCLSFGAKRPDWLREINNEKIKQFLASRGMIKGHSGSPSSEQEQTLQLADDQHRTPSGSSQSTGELLLSDELPGGPLSSVRDHHEIDGIYPVCTSYPPTSYDSSPIYPHPSSQSQLYLSRPDSPGFGHPQQDYNYSPETSFFLTSHATSPVVPWTAAYQMRSPPEMYAGYEDEDVDLFDGLLDPMDTAADQMRSPPEMYDGFENTFHQSYDDSRRDTEQDSRGRNSNDHGPWPGDENTDSRDTADSPPSSLLVPRAPLVPLELSMEDTPSKIAGGLIATLKLGLIMKEIITW